MEMSQAAKPTFGDGFSAIFRIFTSPSTVYPQIRDGLSIWPVLIGIVLISAVLGVLNAPFNEEASLAMMSSMTERGVVPESVLEDQATAEPTPAWQSALGGGFGTVIMYLISGFFYWLILLIFFGSVRFLSVFSISLYVGLIGVLFQILNYLYLTFADVEITSMRDLVLDLSPAILFGQSTSFGVVFLSTLNIFAIWSTILLVKGFAILVGRSWKNTLIPTLIVTILGLLIQSIFLWFAMGQSG